MVGRPMAPVRYILRRVLAGRFGVFLTNYILATYGPLSKVSFGVRRHRKGTLAGPRDGIANQYHVLTTCFAIMGVSYWRMVRAKSVLWETDFTQWVFGFYPLVTVFCTNRRYQF